MYIDKHNHEQEVTDRELVIRSQTGEPEAFKALLQRHWSQFYFQAYRWVHNPTDAEEIVQQGVIKIYQNLHTLREPDKFGGWGKTIIRNLCSNFLKEKKKEKTVLENYTQQYRLDSKQQLSQMDLRGEIDHRSQQEIVLRAISKLSEKYRAVALLSFAEDLNCHEIAQRLNISEGIAEIRLFRARKKILQLLGGKP